MPSLVSQPNVKLGSNNGKFATQIPANIHNTATNTANCSNTSLLMSTNKDRTVTENRDRSQSNSKYISMRKDYAETRHGSVPR